MLWNKFDEFLPGTDFSRWAITVARYQVLYFRRRQRKDVLRFSDSALEAIDQTATAAADQFEDVRSALDHCLERLSANDRDLFRRRYLPGAEVPRIATELGRPATTIYSALDRIRRNLMRCIQRYRRIEGEA